VDSVALPGVPSPAGSWSASGAASVSRRLELRWPVLQAIAGLFIFVHGMVAFVDPAVNANLALEAGTLLAVAAAAIWLSLDAPNPLPRFRTVGILALCGIAEVLQLFQAPPANPLPFLSWHIGAITLLLLVLAVRGHPALAWFAYGYIVAGTIVWALGHGMSLAEGVSLVVRHAGTLLAGTLFAIGMRRSARSLAALHKERQAQAFAEAAATAAIDEREAQLHRVNAMARPLLEQLARRPDLSDDERADCLQVEASLRDAMRARLLFVEPVISAARAARRRGVEVMLLDDSGDQPPADLPAVVRVIATELDSVDTGAFTARLLPSDRGDRATIVIDSSSQRMLVVAADGTARPV
jgi:hypothetical protein